MGRERMTDHGESRPNPYVGPRPFEAGEPFYGRDREALELLNVLIADRIVLLHSASGAGKTSLIQAALIPSLDLKGFHYLPVMRVGLELSPEARLAGAGGNRYLHSVL